jgi:hypothetical protein
MNGFQVFLFLIWFNFKIDPYVKVDGYQLPVAGNNY